MKCQAVQSHELTEISFVSRSPSSRGLSNVCRSQSDSSQHLAPNDSKLEHSQALNKPNSKSRDFLKHVGLQLPDCIVGRALSWRSPEEHRKVAVYKSRRIAAFNSLLHLLPLAVAVVLLSLFWTRHWVGGASDEGTSLQFAAKLHELLMQASLIDILLYIIRVQAISGYLPLGALSGAAKAPQLSYLWSLDFLSAILSPTFNLRRKVAFTLSVTGLLSMTAIVGPSSAVLMIPRPGMPHNVDVLTRYVNLTESSIFPDYIHNNSGTLKPGMLNFTSYGELQEYNLLETNLTADGHELYTYLFRSHEERVDGAIGLIEYFRSAIGIDLADTTKWNIASVPTMLSTRRLFRNSPLGTYEAKRSVRSAKSDNLRWTTYTSQPVVRVKCSSIQDSKIVYYVRDDGSQGPLPNATGLSKSLWSNYTNDNRDLRSRPVLWTKSPDGSKPLLLLFPGSLNNSLVVCTVNSFWYTTLTTMVPIDTGFAVQISLPDSIEGILEAEKTDIVLDVDLLSSLGTPFTGRSTSGGDLVLCLANALSLFPGFHVPNTGNDPNSFEGWDRSELSDSTILNKFQITETIDGFGFGATGTSIRLAVAAIITYCVIVITYVSYIITTGHTSIAWDSATELIMLALQSKEPAGLGHISVGLDSMETFRKGVGIRVSTRKDESTGEAVEKLVLVFEDDEDAEKKKEFTKIERGKAY